MDGIRVTPNASIGDGEGSRVLLTECSKATISMRAPRNFTANAGPTTDPRPIVCTLKLITGALTLQLEAPVA
jgi:hypothetical protein